MKKILASLLAVAVAVGVTSINTVFATNEVKDRVSYPSSFATSEEREAVSLIVNLANDTFKLINDTKKTDSEIEDWFSKTIDAKFNVKQIAKATLANYNRDFNDSQFQRYCTILKSKVMQMYLSNFKSYKNAQLHILQTLSGKHITITSQLQLSGKEPTSIKWFIRKDKASGAWLITNVIAESIDIRKTLKDVFQSILSDYKKQKKDINTFLNEQEAKLSTNNNHKKV